MSDIPDGFMLIGLHKLAAERGDGLVPELLALYSTQARLVEATPLVLNPPARTPDEVSAKPAGNDNVIHFRPYLLARKRR
jgi:hypothetical protein